MANTKQTTFDCLCVTQVQVFQEANQGRIKALACVVLNDQFSVRGLQVIDGENGLFVGYPNDPFYEGEDFCSICFPNTRQLREHIENCVLEKYRASLDPVEWKVRFRIADSVLETIVKEVDRNSAIDYARVKLATRFGDALENAEVEVAEEVSK